VRLLILLHIGLIAGFSKAEFFKVMSGKEVGDMTSMIEKLELNSNQADNMAYVGALKMRKSEFLKQAKAKLDLFKQGKLLLENAIIKNADNPEYRFLRLMIQEHAPKILKYNHQVEADTKLIIKEYDHLPPDIKDAVLNYAKTSPGLKKFFYANSSK
jgi:hypothetical protein